MRDALLGIVAALLAETSLGGVSGEAVSRAQPVASAPLGAFEGRFAYRGAPVDVVAHQGRLYAVLEDAAYPLQSAGGDRFVNGGGQPIEFLRDPGGRVVAVREGRDRFDRLADHVPATSRALLIPRPAGPYRYRPPARLNDGLAVGALTGGTRTDLASRIVSGVISGRFAKVHSILIHHRGRLVLEEYFHGFDRARPHQMRSLTKGLIALVAGAAIDRGLVSLGDAALPPLTADPAGLSAAHRAITLADLLAMRARLSCDDERADAAVNDNNLYGREDWMQAFVTAPVEASSAPEAAYCSAGMLAAGRFLEVRAAAPIGDLARRTLFRPMGIADAAWSWPFVLTAAGANEFGQVRLRPRDMLKLGVMVLGQGRFDNRQILSRAWIAAMTTRRSVIDGDAWGYGIWFRDYRVTGPAGPRTIATIMFSGNGGQKIYVIPTLDLVIVATGGSYNEGNAPINAMMVEEILPAFLGAGNDGARR